MKTYNEKSDEWYCLEVNVQYLEKVHQFLNDLTFLLERMKLKKFENLVTYLHDKNEYAISIRNLKYELNYELVLK